MLPNLRVSERSLSVASLFVEVPSKNKSAYKFPLPFSSLKVTLATALSELKIPSILKSLNVYPLYSKDFILPAAVVAKRFFPM